MRPITQSRRAFAASGCRYRVIPGRRLGQTGEERGLGDRQLVERLVEVVERRGGDAVGADAEIDLVEIELEDLVLGEGVLDAEREQRLLDLAAQRDLAAQEEVLGDLLGDGRSPDRPAIVPQPLEVGEDGAQDARAGRFPDGRRSSCPRPRGRPGSGVWGSPRPVRRSASHERTPPSGGRRRRGSGSPSAAGSRPAAGSRADRRRSGAGDRARRRRR